MDVLMAGLQAYDGAMTSSPVPESLLRSIVAEFAPRKVILFGSAARGEAGPDSDLDLLVVLDDDVPLEKLGAKAVHAAAATTTSLWTLFHVGPRCSRNVLGPSGRSRTLSCVTE